jgi:hypothetical protein
MRLSKNKWEQIKTAYAAGIGLRELARNMEIPAGTVLARAKREGWTQQIAAAKLIERPHLAREIAKPHAINAITPMQSAAAAMQQRGECYRERIAGVSEKVAGHLETMAPDDILNRASQLKRFDSVARRTFGLDDAEKGTGALNLAVLCGGRAIVQVAPRSLNSWTAWLTPLGKYLANRR